MRHPTLLYRCSAGGTLRKKNEDRITSSQDILRGHLEKKQYPSDCRRRCSIPNARELMNRSNSKDGSPYVSISQSICTPAIKTILPIRGCGIQHPQRAGLESSKCRYMPAMQEVNPPEVGRM